MNHIWIATEREGNSLSFFVVDGFFVRLFCFYLKNSRANKPLIW